MAKDFSRDLGYLDKFLRALRDHAATLEAPASTRLLALLDEQDRAWSEIKGLLAGTPVSVAMASPVQAAAEPAPRVAAESAASESPAAKIPDLPPRRLTVGSLMTPS